MADPTKHKEWSTGRDDDGAQGACGASINAKVLKQEAPFEMSMLMHAAYGENQYPSYFLKWDPKQLDDVIALMEKQIASAKKAREAMIQRKEYIEQYKPLHDWSRDIIDLVSPQIALALKQNSLLSDDPSLTTRLGLQFETDGIYSFDLLSSKACEKIREEIDHYLKYRDAYVASHDGEFPPGSMKNRLQIADIRGLDSLETKLFQAVVQPLAKHIFGRDPVLAGEPPGDVDTPHTFVVGYGPSEAPQHNVTKNALVPHVDDSEVTLNLCLDANFQGGGLVFHGKRDPINTTIAYELPHPNEYVYQHKLGRAVFHLGNHFHEVLPVTRGERHVLIMWLRSWKGYRASHCPCCLKFQRHFCVCSPEWN